MRSVPRLLIGVALMWTASTASTVTAQTPAGPAAVPASAKSLTAAIPSSPATIDQGRVLYQKYCRFCHGSTGTGGTASGPNAVKPSNLADKQWTRGSSEGEIFWVIQNGAPPKYDMKGFKGTLSDESIWKLVHYVRSLGGVTK